MEEQLAKLTPDVVECLKNQVREELKKEAKDTEARQKLENEDLRREVAELVDKMKNGLEKAKNEQEEQKIVLEKLVEDKVQNQVSSLHVNFHNVQKSN